jgi:hypothetical protein
MKIRDGFIAEISGVRRGRRRSLIRALLAAWLDAGVVRNLAGVIGLLAGWSAGAIVGVRGRVVLVRNDPDL